MYNVHYLNKISAKGTAVWPDSYASVDSPDGAHAILVRSSSMNSPILCSQLPVPAQV